MKLISPALKRVTRWGMARSTVAFNEYHNEL